MGAVSDSAFGEQAIDLGLHRCRRDVEALGDLVIAVPVGDLDQHLTFPIAQQVEAMRGLGVDLEAVGALPSMPGYQDNMDRAPALISKARECRVPVVFFQEAHRRDLVDFGRELDGAGDVHLLEGHPGTEVAANLGMRPDDYSIKKRRYSCFFGTEFEILLKGLGVPTH